MIMGAKAKSAMMKIRVCLPSERPGKVFRG